MSPVSVACRRSHPGRALQRADHAGVGRTGRDGDVLRPDDRVLAVLHLGDDDRVMVLTVLGEADGPERRLNPDVPERVSNCGGVEPVSPAGIAAAATFSAAYACIAW